MIVGWVLLLQTEQRVISITMRGWLSPSGNRVVTLHSVNPCWRYSCQCLSTSRKFCKTECSQGWAPQPEQIPPTMLCMPYLLAMYSKQASSFVKILPRIRWVQAWQMLVLGDAMARA